MHSFVTKWCTEIWHFLLNMFVNIEEMVEILEWKLLIAIYQELITARRLHFSE